MIEKLLKHEWMDLLMQDSDQTGKLTCFINEVNGFISLYHIQLRNRNTILPFYLNLSKNFILHRHLTNDILSDSQKNKRGDI